MVQSSLSCRAGKSFTAVVFQGLYQLIGLAGNSRLKSMSSLVFIISVGQILRRMHFLFL